MTLILDPEWYRIWCEGELEAFVRGGWTDFTVRPHGSTMWVFMDENLFNRELAQLTLPGFRQRRPPSWTLFREISFGLKHGQVCVPGPLSAHDLAQLEVGKSKSRGLY